MIFFLIYILQTRTCKAAGGATKGVSEFICSQALAKVSILADDSSIAAADKSSKVTKSTEIKPMRDF